MYARVSTAQIKPGTVDQSLDIWRQQILPAARQQRGFRGVKVMHDRKSDRTVVVTFWDTEADADASRDSDFMRGALSALGPFLDGAPDQQHLEVLLDESA